MVLLWLAFGAVVGALSAPAGQGSVGLLAGACAGLVALPWLGLMLAVIGGRCRDTILGAMWGTACGFIGGAASKATSVPTAMCVCLIIGGLAGATFPQICHIEGCIVRRVFAGLCSSRMSHATEAVVSQDRAISP
jgi:hypothetical protein